jgi:signal transduction histidine kinase
VDNQAGIRQAVSHLIGIHGHRQIAFVRGPAGHPEAEERYQGYVEELAHHNLPVDPSLVAPGDFVYSSGQEAVRILVDERKVSFDAIVVSNDESALGVLSGLQERGLRVPQDVALIGFDDIDEARFSTPPLTTVRQPLYEQGRRAAETLLDHLSGKAIPEQVALPPRLIIRESCGCFQEQVRRAAVGGLEWSSDSLLAAYQAEKEAILQASAWIQLPAGMGPNRLENILTAFMTEACDPDDRIFMPVLHTFLGDLLNANRDIESIQTLISAMRSHMLPHLHLKDEITRAEDLWHKARVLIGQMSQLEQARARLQVVRQAVNFSSLSESLMTAFDLTELMNAVARELPPMGVESCYLSLYDQPVDGENPAPAEWSRLVLAYDHCGRVALQPGGNPFRSKQLVPDRLLSREGRYAVLLEPLHFGREVQFGFILLGPLDREGGAFREILLSRQISTALRVSSLLEERRQGEEALKSYSERLEEMVEERTGELQDALQKARQADQMKSEFVANVNHELRTPLTNLILYYQMLSARPGEKTKERLDVIGREIQRLRTLIENLLNLSRLDLAQSTLRTAPNDLNRLVLSLVNDRQSLMVERGLTLITELSPALPPIPLDEGMMVQAISNLLTNAMNYTPSGGEIHLKTRLIEDAAGNGWGVLIVQDTGPGISTTDLPHIFERFYRGKAGRDTGAPGTGLGLAIVKEVVKKHHGRIDVENSADGCGTIFTVRLPVEPPPGLNGYVG